MNSVNDMRANSVPMQVRLKFINLKGLDPSQYPSRYSVVAKPYEQGKQGISLDTVGYCSCIEQ